MPILAMSAGKVTAIWGSAFVRSPDGSMRVLQVGDTVAGGERILTEDNGLVQISPIKGPAVVHKAAPVAVDKAIAGIESQDPEQAPAAGLTGGADGGMQPGLRVDRVVETVTPLSFEYGTPDRGFAVPPATSGIKNGQVFNSEPQVSINSVTVNEGAPNAVFTVTLDRPSTSVVTVSFATAGGSAESSRDFKPTVGTVTFQPGQTSQTISVPVINDAVYEGSEKFTVKLSGVSNATILNGTGTGEILDNGEGTRPAGVAADDDRPHVLSVSDASTTEGGMLDFVVKLTHESNTDTRLQLDVLPGETHPVTLGLDTAGMQVFRANGSSPMEPLTVLTDAQGHKYVLVPAGTPVDASIVVRVPTVNDKLPEFTESIKLQAAVAPDANGAPVGEAVTGKGTVIDNDQPYMLVESGTPAVEGSPVVFDVKLTHEAAGPVTVKLALASGVDDPATLENESATFGIDTGTKLEVLDANGQWVPVGPDGLVTFAQGQTLIQVRVATVDDKIAEDTEYIKLQATVVSGETVNQTHANQTAITDNDVVPGVLEPIHDQVSAQDTNLMIVLDTSGSMANPSGIDGLSRLQAAIKAIDKLIDRYDQYGDVSVRLVTFGTETHIQGDAWMSAHDAKDLLTKLSADGATNYDYALAAAQDAFRTSAGKLVGAQNVAYFLSDGNPSLSSAYPTQGVKGQSVNLTQPGLGDGIDAAEEATWLQFLNANQIKSYAIGMGAEVSKTYLDPVAYDGHASSNSDGVVVSNFNQLESVLTGTTQDFVEGNLSAHGSIGLPGGAFQHVDSITVDGVVHAFDAAQHSLVLSTALGGVLTMDMLTGHYSYAAPSTPVTGLALESFSFSLLKLNGEAASSTLDIQFDHTQVHVGTDAANVITGGATADLIMGREGADVISADGGNDLVYGNGGNDELHGGAGDDHLVGGQGSDVMFGDAGSDVFVWRLSDHGASATTADRAVDTIKDFDVASVSNHGDVLDLRDLLQGENTTGGTGNLEQYLRIDTSGGNTVIHVSPVGDFVSGNQAAGSETQTIVLEGVNLRTDMGLNAAATSQQVIAKMLEQGKLLVDQI